MHQCVSPLAFSPPIESTGIASLVFASSAKSFASLGKRREVGKARGHPAGTRVRLRVRTAIHLRDRSRLVSGEIVPEVLEVGAFASPLTNASGVGP